MHISTRRRQQGAILVTSLLLLLVLTVLGVAMMKMTNMQERMAGNTRDLNLALQGAEAALRDAETQLEALAEAPVGVPGPGCMYCEKFTLPLNLDDTSVFDWTANAHEFEDDGTQEITNLDEDPRFTIEEAGEDPDSLVQGEPGGIFYYTITSRSTGATGQANTVLQSTFARR